MCPIIVAAHCPVSADQTLSCVSDPPLSITTPDGKNLAVFTSNAWPDNSRYNIINIKTWLTTLKMYKKSSVISLDQDWSLVQAKRKRTWSRHKLNKMLINGQMCSGLVAVMGHFTKGWKHSSKIVIEKSQVKPLHWGLFLLQISYFSLKVWSESALMILLLY